MHALLLLVGVGIGTIPSDVTLPSDKLLYHRIVDVTPQACLFGHGLFSGFVVASGGNRPAQGFAY